MQEKELFILADKTLMTVVNKIQDSQWGMEMPLSLVGAGKQEKVTLRETINYHAYDDAWVPDMMLGKTMEEAGKDKFKGDLLADSPKENFANFVEKACAAVEQLDDLERIIHFSYGDYPAREALKHITSFRGLRVYDLSKALGLDTNMPPDLVKGLWEMLSPQIEEWRSFGVFPKEVKVPGNASLQDKLLGMTGRHP